MLPLTTFSRTEYIDSITYADNTIQTLRTNGGLLPNDRFMASIMLEFRGRLTMPATGGPTGLQADGIAALIERVTVEGYHRIRTQQEKFIDLRGSDLEQLQKHYNPSAFIKTPVISITANATNDIVVQIQVPFTPLRMPIAIASGYLLDAPNYESLKLTIQWGNQTSVVVAGGTPAVWSAFGSASGTPELRVYGGFAMHPTRFAGLIPGRVFRYFQEISGSIPTTTGSGTRIWDIPKGFDIRNILLKTGTKATNVTGGNNSFATLTEFLSDIRINMGLGRYIRRYLNSDAAYFDLAESYNLPFGRIPGVTLIDFAQFGNLGEVLNTRGMVSGPTGNVDLYVSADVVGAANQAVVGAIEEIRFRPIIQAGA